MFARLARLLGAGAFVALAAACLSPTLPLPPPDAADNIETGSIDTEWIVRGACVEGAEVVVLNEATGIGAAFEDRDGFGHYSVVIKGNRCDLVSVRQSVGNESSNETTFVLQETTNGTVDDPVACAP